MNQLTMFGAPRARRTDPETSHEAARLNAAKLDNHKAMVLDLVLKFPGSTAGELAKKWTHPQNFHWRRIEVGRRAPELVRDGSVVHGGARECTVMGSRQLTLYPVDL